MTAGGRQDWSAFGAAGHLPQGIIYPELVHSGLTETLIQNTDVFNAASRNAIRLVPNRRRGGLGPETSTTGAMSSGTTVIPKVSTAFCTFTTPSQILHI